MAALSSLTRDGTWAPAVKVLSPGYWTIRDSPSTLFLLCKFLKIVCELKSFLSLANIINFIINFLLRLLKSEHNLDFMTRN